MVSAEQFLRDVVCEDFTRVRFTRVRFCVMVIIERGISSFLKAQAALGFFADEVPEVPCGARG